MEKLALKSLSSQVKIVGTVITMAGAVMVVLYKGPVLISTHSSSASLYASALVNTITAQSDWVKGGVLLAAEYTLVSVWYICQVTLSNNFFTFTVRQVGA